MIALGIRDPRVLSIQPYRQHFEELTWKCLTTPYDRKLIRCTEVTGQPRYCLLEFDQRRREQLAR